MTFKSYKTRLRRVHATEWYDSFIGNPKNHLPQYGMKFQSFGDAVPGGYNGTFGAYHPESGEYMGHLDYNSADNDAVIADIQVDPQHQRKGVATSLFDYARRYMPDTAWRHGLTTPEGEAWRRSLPEELQGNVPALEPRGDE